MTYNVNTHYDLKCYYALWLTMLTHIMIYKATFNIKTHDLQCYNINCDAQFYTRCDL